MNTCAKCGACLASGKACRKCAAERQRKRRREMVKIDNSYAVRTHREVADLMHLRGYPMSEQSVLSAEIRGLTKVFNLLLMEDYA